VEHLEHNWDQQREQLSALLDNELSEQERAELTAHLSTCAACRAELESLRRTSALMRALPAPALPRSFVLPLDAAPAQEPPRQTDPVTRKPTSITSRQRSSVRALQWISAIAAVLGIILLLSSAFSHLPSRGYTTANSAPVSAGSTQDSNTPAQSTRTIQTQPDLPTPIATGNAVSPTPKTKIDQGNGTEHLANNTTSSYGTLISITGLGVLLLILSACSFAGAWMLRRRW
jgi:negative regulator of sigma E activity